MRGCEVAEIPVNIIKQNWNLSVIISPVSLPTVLSHKITRTLPHALSCAPQHTTLFPPPMSLSLCHPLCVK